MKLINQIHKDNSDYIILLEYGIHHSNNIWSFGFHVFPSYCEFLSNTFDVKFLEFIATMK